MKNNTQTLRNILFEGGGVLSSILLALYYKQAATLAQWGFTAIQEGAYIPKHLSPFFMALSSTLLLALLLGGCLCLAWLWVRTDIAPPPPINKQAALAHFLYSQRPRPSGIYTILVIALAYTYNLFIFSPAHNIAGYSFNLASALLPLVSIHSVIAVIMIGSLIDFYAVKKTKISILIISIILLGIPILLRRISILPLNEEGGALAYFIVSKIPLVIGIAIIVDIFRRINKPSSYIGLMLSASIIAVVSQPIASTSLIGILLCCIIFGLLRIARTSLRFMLGLHVASQIVAYFVFRSEILLRYNPALFKNPFLYN